MNNSSDDKAGTVIPFGKYKGRDVIEVLQSDPKYLEWCMQQAWFRDKYISLQQIIINRGAEPEETPEHNALQILFLDLEFCQRFCVVLNEKFGFKRKYQILSTFKKEFKHNDESGDLSPGDKEEIENLKKQGWVFEWDYTPKRISRGRITVFGEEICIEPKEWKAYVVFEKHGVDVTIKFRINRELIGINIEEHQVISDLGPYLGTNNDDEVSVEVKPSVGDDYPAVLRQMNGNGSEILFLETYSGIGATEEQFVKFFKNSGKQVVFKRDVM